MEKIYALNYRNSFLKINLPKFTILSNFTDSQDLSEQSLNVAILCLSMRRKLTHLDKDLKRRPFLCLQTWKN